MINSGFKQRLHKHCVKLLEERIAIHQQAMRDAQESANSEEKSSAGDKYETGRAMSQIQSDMSAKQLKAASDELARLNKIKPEQLVTMGGNGALVCTDSSIIYIAAGIGMLVFENTEVAIVSPTSPIATGLLGKKAGDWYVMNGKQHCVISLL